MTNLRDCYWRKSNISLVIHSSSGRIGYNHGLANNKAMVSFGENDAELHPEELEKVYNPSLEHLLEVSCVIISKQTNGKQRTGCGLGMYDNTILTTADNICDRIPEDKITEFVKKVYVASNRFFSEAEVIKVDWDANLALIKTAEPFSVRTEIFFDTDANAQPDGIGDKILIARTSDKHKNLHFTGHICQNPYQIYFNAKSPKLIQVEAEDTNIYSGAPVVDARFKVIVGMMTNIVAPHKGDGLSFMIPIAYIESWLRNNGIMYGNSYNRTDGHPKLQGKGYTLDRFREKDFTVVNNTGKRTKILRAKTKNDGFKNHEAWINEKQQINELLNKSGIADLLSEYIFVEE